MSRHPLSPPVQVPQRGEAVFVLIGTAGLGTPLIGPGIVTDSASPYCILVKVPWRDTPWAVPATCLVPLSS
jgi:hypothetical protein